MKFNDSQVERLSRVPIRVLQKKVQELGWEPIHQIPQLTAYSHPKGAGSVLKIPTSKKFIDYQDVMEDLLRNIVAINKVSPESALHKLGAAPVREKEGTIRLISPRRKPWDREPSYWKASFVTETNGNTIERVDEFLREGGESKIASLASENDALRKENQRLRKAVKKQKSS